MRTESDDDRLYSEWDKIRGEDGKITRGSLRKTLEHKGLPQDAEEAATALLTDDSLFFLLDVGDQRDGPLGPGGRISRQDIEERLRPPPGNR